MPQINQSNPSAAHLLYAIHPGHVISENDGQRHFVDAARLCGLYGLRDGEYIVMQDTLPFGRRDGDRDELIHLYPQVRYADYQGAAQIIDARRRGSSLTPPHLSGHPPQPVVPNLNDGIRAEISRQNEENRRLGMPPVGRAGFQPIDQGNISSNQRDALSFDRLIGRGEVSREQFRSEIEGTFAPPQNQVLTEQQIRQTVNALRERDRSSANPPRAYIDMELRTVAHVEAECDRVIWVLTHPPGESRRNGRMVSNGALAAEMLAAIMRSNDLYGLDLPTGWSLQRLGPESSKRRRIKEKRIVRRRIQSTGEL